MDSNQVDIGGKSGRGLKIKCRLKDMEDGVGTIGETGGGNVQALGVE